MRIDSVAGCVLERLRSLDYLLGRCVFLTGRTLSAERFAFAGRDRADALSLWLLGCVAPGERARSIRSGGCSRLYRLKES